LFQDAPVWVRLGIHHAGKTPAEFFLELESPMLDSVSLFQVQTGTDGARHIIRHAPQGDHHPLEERPLRHRMPMFAMTLEPDSTVDLYLRIDSRSAIIVPITMWGRDAFYARYDGLGLYYGVFFGVMGVMALYNLFIWLFIREHAYLYYVCYVLSAMFFQAVMNGYGFRYLWHDVTWMVDHSLLVSVALAFIFGGAFVIRFLDLRNTDPVFYWIALVGISLYVPLIYASPYVSEAILTMIAQPLGMVLSLMVIWVGIRQWKRNSQVARFFVGGWAILVAGTNVYTLMLAGIVPYNEITRHIQEVGMMAEVVLLSFALASRINEERQARRLALETSLSLSQQINAANEERLQAQEMMNRELENRVSDRTRKLSEALDELSVVNQQLEALSQTDQLTGLHNRRWFDPRFQEVFAHARRHRQPLSVLMCDVDHFKKVNDTHGHLAGDECLRQVAAALRQAVLRPEDMLARFGGEEFVLALANTDPGGAARVAERIRARVEGIVLVWEGQRIPLTISVGLGSFSHARDEDPTQLLHRADEALYLAKQNGRNRVEACPDFSG
jgi:diguanylate cyclase (GGDEF)-like protein